MVHLSKRDRHHFYKLANFELQQSAVNDGVITADDILGDLDSKQRPHLFLDFYSIDGMRKALEEYGVFKTLKRRGFEHIELSIDTQDPYSHKFRAYFDEKVPENLLCEAYFRKKNYIAKPMFPSSIQGENFLFIVIEWLTLQDPTQQFTAHRRALPGQKYPGLRIGRKVLVILINMCLRLRADGLLNIPEHYHNAAFYGRYFKYFNPHTEGFFQAIRRDLSQMGIYKLTWAIELECLIEHRTGEYWKWFTDEQILPVSMKMEKYFNSKEYIEKVEEASQSVSFRIDEDKFRELGSDYIKDEPI
ncbi:hypothetical protein JXB12_00755, partial [candidate division KSB1 bacterium]|nr:hypothetical protein [candidate division KSB1 bacterium]